VSVLHIAISFSLYAYNALAHAEGINKNIFIHVECIISFNIRIIISCSSSVVLQCQLMFGFKLL